MKGYIAVINREYERYFIGFGSNTLYLRDIEEDWDWDSLHISPTDCIEEAMFISEGDKHRIESLLVSHYKEGHLRFIKAIRNTILEVV